MDSKVSLIYTSQATDKVCRFKPADINLSCNDDCTDSLSNSHHWCCLTCLTECRHSPRVILANTDDGFCCSNRTFSHHHCCNWSHGTKAFSCHHEGSCKVLCNFLL